MLRLGSYAGGTCRFSAERGSRGKPNAVELFATFALFFQREQWKMEMSLLVIKNTML